MNIDQIWAHNTAEETHSPLLSSWNTQFLHSGLFVVLQPVAVKLRWCQEQMIISSAKFYKTATDRLLNQSIKKILCNK